jgi:hypothetical protein
MAGSSFLGKTLHEAGRAYVKWLCSDTFVWYLPKSLNLFYALCRYTQEHPELKLELPVKAYDAFLDFWKTAVPSVFGDPDGEEDVADDEGGGGGEEEYGLAAAVAAADDALSPLQNQRINNVTSAASAYFFNNILPRR